jgi:hypothetical protein
MGLKLEVPASEIINHYSIVMESKSAPQYYSHRCELCGMDFACETRWLAREGFVMCHCEQAIIHKPEEKQAHARLAFYCSWLCFNEDFPEPDSEEDTEELPPLVSKIEEALSRVTVSDEDREALHQEVVEAFNGLINELG